DLGCAVRTDLADGKRGEHLHFGRGIVEHRNEFGERRFRLWSEDQESVGRFDVNIFKSLRVKTKPVVTLGNIKESLAQKCIARLSSAEQRWQRIFSDSTDRSSGRGIEIDVLQRIFEFIVLSGLFQPGA